MVGNFVDSPLPSMYYGRERRAGNAVTFHPTGTGKPPFYTEELRDHDDGGPKSICGTWHVPRAAA